MLPMKLDLTEELAATLRQLRLEHPVNGEILTAEKLSKAIGNNRAWMSQIESRRLKKIRREDIIAIYKVLYNEKDDYHAEYRAEVDLMEFLFTTKRGNAELITGGSIDNLYSNDSYNEYRSKHGGTDYTDDDLLIEKKYLMESCTNIVNNFMEELKKIPSVLEHNNYINKFLLFEEYLRDCFEDTLFLIDEIPLHTLQYATDEQRKDYVDSISNISNKLHDISTKHNLENFISELNAAKMILTDYDKYKNDFSVDKLLKNVTVLLVYLSQHVTGYSLLSMEEKIQYTNDMVYIVYRCSIILKSKQLFNIKSLTKDATITDISDKINELQLFLSGIEDNPFLIRGQISKYFTT